MISRILLSVWMTGSVALAAQNAHADDLDMEQYPDCQFPVAEMVQIIADDNAPKKLADGPTTRRQQPSASDMNNAMSALHWIANRDNASNGVYKLGRPDMNVCHAAIGMDSAEQVLLIYHHDGLQARTSVGRPLLLFRNVGHDDPALVLSVPHVKNEAHTLDQALEAFVDKRGDRYPAALPADAVAGLHDALQDRLQDAIPPGESPEGDADRANITSCSAYVVCPRSIATAPAAMRRLPWTRANFYYGDRSHFLHLEPSQSIKANYREVVIEALDAVLPF